MSETVLQWVQAEQLRLASRIDDAIALPRTQEMVHIMLGEDPAASPHWLAEAWKTHHAAWASGNELTVHAAAALLLLLLGGDMQLPLDAERFIEHARTSAAARAAEGRLEPFSQTAAATLRAYAKMVPVGNSTIRRKTPSGQEVTIDPSQERWYQLAADHLPALLRNEDEAAPRLRLNLFAANETRDAMSERGRQLLEDSGRRPEMAAHLIQWSPGLRKLSAADQQAALERLERYAALLSENPAMMDLLPDVMELATIEDIGELVVNRLIGAELHSFRDAFLPLPPARTVMDINLRLLAVLKLLEQEPRFAPQSAVDSRMVNVLEVTLPVEMETLICWAEASGASWKSFEHEVSSGLCALSCFMSLDGLERDIVLRLYASDTPENVSAAVQALSDANLLTRSDKWSSADSAAAGLVRRTADLERPTLATVRGVMGFNRAAEYIERQAASSGSCTHAQLQWRVIPKLMRMAGDCLRCGRVAVEAPALSGMLPELRTQQAPAEWLNDESAVLRRERQIALLQDNIARAAQLQAAQCFADLVPKRRRPPGIRMRA